MNTFRIDIPQDPLDDLQARLARTRLPDVAPGQQAKGFPIDRVRELLDAWRDFDWRAAEERLNRYPQVVTSVQDVPVHVVHARGGDRLPVVLLHGWADTFFGPLHLVDRLVAAGHDVIVPSTPGSGFSGQPVASLTTESVAETIDDVVRQLGVDRYAVAGGDWGGAIAEQLALSHPDRVAAIHLTDVPFQHIFMVDAADATDDAERAFLSGRDDWGGTDGYIGIQSSQPLTLAYGLADSPVGLLAWIGEKMSAWTDREPSIDDLLTQVSIYWFTNTIYSSMRLYAEGMGDWDEASWDDVGDTGEWGGDDAESADAADWAAPATTIPSGFAIFPADIGQPPRSFAERFFTDIRRFTSMPAGGHFANREEPDALAAEIIAFLDEVEGR